MKMKTSTASLSPIGVILAVTALVLFDTSTLAHGQQVQVRYTIEQNTTNSIFKILCVWNLLLHMSHLMVIFV